MPAPPGLATGPPKAYRQSLTPSLGVVATRRQVTLDGSAIHDHAGDHLLADGTTEHVTTGWKAPAQGSGNHFIALTPRLSGWKRPAAICEKGGVAAGERHPSGEGSPGSVAPASFEGIP